MDMYIMKFRLCKLIKQAGFPQETAFYWLEQDDGIGVLVGAGELKRSIERSYSAYTVGEFVTMHNKEKQRNAVATLFKDLLLRILCLSGRHKNSELTVDGVNIFCS